MGWVEVHGLDEVEVGGFVDDDQAGETANEDVRVPVACGSEVLVGFELGDQVTLSMIGMGCDTFWLMR